MYVDLDEYHSLKLEIMRKLTFKYFYCTFHVRDLNPTEMFTFLILGDQLYESRIQSRLLKGILRESRHKGEANINEVNVSRHSLVTIVF